MIRFIAADPPIIEEDFRICPYEACCGLCLLNEMLIHLIAMQKRELCITTLQFSIAKAINWLLNMPDYFCRDTCGDDILGNRFCDHRSCSYYAVIANSCSFQYDDSASEPNIITDRDGTN